MSASDEIIWQTINQRFCAYKVKAPSLNFCRNEYNVSGLCNRQSCPLANSRYATVREREGRLYLYMKSVERSHMPSKLWERIKLSKNTAGALKQVDERLAYWPNFNTHKCKQRFLKLQQYLIQSRYLALKTAPKLIAIKPKQTKREAARERKALTAAKLEKTIEKELIERLKSGVYGEQPLNVNEDVWKRFLDNMNGAEVDASDEEVDEDENEAEFVEESDVEEEQSDIEDWWANSEDENSEDSEANGKQDKKRKAESSGAKAVKKPKRVEIEYEHEMEPAQPQLD